MKTFRKVFFVSSLAIFLILGGGLIYLYFNQDKIINAVVDEINGIIDVEAKVENIELNIFDHWPYVSIELQNVSLRGKNCAINQKLLEAKEFSILLNPITLIQNDFDIRRIHVSDGQIHIYQSKICNNYDILKKDGKTSGSFELKGVELINMQVNYFSNETLQKYDFYALSMDINGIISNEIIDIHNKGNVEAHLIKTGSYVFDHEELIEISHGFIWKKDSSIIRVESLGADLLDSKVSGSAKFDFKNEFMNIDLESKALNIAHAEKFLNKEAWQYLTDYDAKGDVSITMNLNGNLYGKGLKGIFDFNSSNLDLNYKKYDQKIKINEMSGTWEIGDLDQWKYSTLKLTSVKGQNEGSDFTLNLQIRDFNKPYLKGQLFTNQKASFISKAMEIPLKNVSGDIEIDLSYEGVLPSNKNLESLSNYSNLTGILTLNTVAFTGIQPEIPFSNLNGQLVFDKKILMIQSLNGNVSKNSFSLDGRIENVIEYFYSDKTPLYIETNIKGDYIDLAEWISDSDDKGNYEIKLPERIVHDHHLKINRLKLKRFDARDISGEFSIRNKQVKLNSFKMKVAGGSILLNMDLDARNDNRIEWFTTGNLNNVYIDSVFYIFKNFNQSFIEQRHLEGQINADFTGFMVSDNNLNFDLDKHIFSINSRITNGKLIFFEPLQAVSKFIREDDLMNLKFDDLENEIFIKDRMITIPKMDISSNVRTIRIQGNHSFENVIDYRFEVPVSAEKVDKDQRFGRIKDEKTGKTKLLLKLTGTVDDYKVSYDKDALKENVKSGIKEELEELKKSLKNQKEKEEEAEIDEDEYFDFN